MAPCRRFIERVWVGTRLSVVIAVAVAAAVTVIVDRRWT
jgi:ABC-type dipeptide/oligopeptide/nickel transport system permease subunit